MTPNAASSPTRRRELQEALGQPFIIENKPGAGGSIGATEVARSVAELIALAKAKPGSLCYASGGNGSAAHIAMKYFELRTQTDIGHIPCKGTSPAATDVIGGQVVVMMTGVPAVLQQVKADRLRALAVSSTKPVASMPDLPTIAATVPDFEAVQSRNPT